MKPQKDEEHFYVLKDRDGLFFGYQPGHGSWGPLGIYTRIWSNTAQMSAFLTTGVKFNYSTGIKIVRDLGMLGDLVNRGGQIVKVKLTEDGVMSLSELKAFKNFEEDIVNKKIEDI